MGTDNIYGNFFYPMELLGRRLTSYIERSFSLDAELNLAILNGTIALQKIQSGLEETHVRIEKIVKNISTAKIFERLMDSQIRNRK